MHGLIYSAACLIIVYLLHHLPVNQLFIDPFSEYIKRHDLMDISCSKFRDHTDPSLFDDRVFVINSEITDRAKVAQTVDFLARHNAKAIGVDLFFDSLKLDYSDTLLHKVSHQFDHIIFANSHSAELQNINHDSIMSDSFLVPFSAQYFVNLASDDGYTVRSFEPFCKIRNEEIPAFAVALADLYKPGVVSQLKSRNSKKEWINFRRNQFRRIGSGNVLEAIPHYGIISMSKFLSDTNLYLVNYFKDKTVLIGFCNGETDQVLKDFYYTPLNRETSRRSLPDMNGVIIHANIISMLLDHDFVYELSAFWLYLIGFALFLFNYYIFIEILKKHLYFNLAFIRLIQLIEFLIAFSVGVWLLSAYSIKISFVLLATIIIMSYEFYEFYSHKVKNPINGFLSRMKWI